MKVEADSSRLSLGGDWVINPTGKHYESLAGERSNALSAVTGRKQNVNKAGESGNLQKDAGKIESVDTSGRQLLTSFLKVLEKDGIVPTIVNLPEPLQELFQWLNTSISETNDGPVENQ